MSEPQRDDLADLLAAERPRKPVEVRWALANLERELFGKGTEAVSISRYVLRERLAEGGLGVVYEAFDPELDRKVAIKLLRNATPALLAEARAVAQLAHPNVVTVHDVGEFDHGDGVFMVMELVAGRTVDQWLREEPRSWREVLDVFMAAGQGLAAAHEAGLVHRDFKPANVMVGDDGRVRVVDFGLAMAAKAKAEADGAVGTPRYMPPEQQRGDPLDARADQFAFCVALAEALPKAHPGFVRAVVDRGRRKNAADRFDSMGDLLDALRRKRWRRRWGRVGLAAAPVLVLAGFGVWSIAGDTDTCTPAEVRLESIWDAPRREAIGAAYGASEKAYVPAAWEALARRIDEAAGEWGRAYAGACAADPSPESAARMLCLERELTRIDAFAGVLEAGSQEVLDRAVTNALPFTAKAPCAEPDDALAEAPLPRELERTLARVEALLLAGQVSEAQALAEAAVSGADGPSAKAEALRLLALSQRANGQVAEAVASGEAALITAERADLQRTAVRAAIDLVLVASYDAGDLRAADRWARLAEAKMVAHAAGTALQAKYALNVAVLRRQQGRFDEAVEDLRRAVELTRELTGGDRLQVARVETTLAAVLHGGGRNGEATDILQRAMAVLIEELGERHPSVATCKVTLGAIALDEGRTEASLALTGEALAIVREAFGPNHPVVGTVLNNHALGLSRAGRFDEGIAALEESLAIKRTQLEDDAPQIANGLSNIGTMLLEAQRPEEALAKFQRALEIRERKLGPDHPDVGAVLANLGAALQELGRDSEAFEAFQRAWSLQATAYGEDNFRILETRWRFGDALVERGRRRDGIAHLRAAVQTGEENHVDPILLADARFALARALVRRNPKRTKELLEAATQAYADPRAAPWRLERLEAWRERAEAAARAEAEEEAGADDGGE